MTFFESGPSRSAPAPYWSGDADDPFTRLRRSRRRRHALSAGAWVAGLLAILVGVVVVVGPGSVYTTVRQVLALEPATPAADVVAVADRAFLTADGRRLLYSSRPEMADREEIGVVCPESSLGCYHPQAGIRVYQPTDPRIADAAVTTLAHELLHAAYDELGDGERFRVHDLLAVEIARVAPEDPVHAQIEASVGDHESSRETEQFAYLGSQVLLDGGFAPELEAVYARWIVDRPALVGVYDRVESVIDGVLADAQGAWDQLARDDSANAAERAQIEADRQWHESARTAYNDQAARYNAMTDLQRANATLEWTGTDGRVRSAAVGEGLELRLQELEAYRVELDRRTDALAAAEAEVAGRRGQVDAQLADVTDLLTSAYPGESFE